MSTAMIQQAQQTSPMIRQTRSTNGPARPPAPNTVDFPDLAPRTNLLTLIRTDSSGSILEPPAPAIAPNQPDGEKRAAQGPSLWASRPALASAVALTFLAFAWLFHSVWTSRRDSADLFPHMVQIERMRGEVLRLDEVLTMSARMAVETGDGAWADRYRVSEPQLDRVIKEIMLDGIKHLTPKIGRDFSGLTAAANERLLEMEYRAFALARVNRGSEARLILAGDGYARQKALYKSGADRLASEVQLELARASRVADTRVLSSLIAGCAGLIIVSFLWLAVAAGHRRRTAAEALVLEERVRADEMCRRASHDPLTDLGNRAYFQERLEQALSRRGREIGSVGIMFIDIDNFKTINDFGGHAMGDALLQATALRLRACLRPADTVARLGGDEFAVLIEDFPDGGYAMALAQRVAGTLRTTLLVRGKAVGVQASVGLAFSRSIDHAAKDLLREADIAMYRSKEIGDGRVAMFEPTMHVDLFDKVSLQSDLESAIERDELVLHYQPVVGLDDLNVVGFESLVRWQHPERGLLPPNDFIPIAEASGMILPMGVWILASACRQLSAWQAAFPQNPPLSMNVNVSVCQLEDPTFAETVAGLLQEFAIPPASLVLEVTETVLLGDEVAHDICRRLKALGVGLALDDFGTGFSSLSYLRRLPFDVVKIDRSFIEELGRQDIDRAIVGAVVRMSRILGLKTVAEGIEDPRQLEEVRALGCDQAQGYHLFRPMPAEDIEMTLTAEIGRRAKAA